MPVASAQMIRPCQTVATDRREDDSQTDKVMACVVDMEVAYFPDKSAASKSSGRAPGALQSHPAPADELYRLPCPTVCAADISRSRAIPLRHAHPLPHTDLPVEGATASGSMDLPRLPNGVRPDRYIQVNGCRDMPPQNATYWLDGKGLSPLMGHPCGPTRNGSNATVDESLSDLLPEGCRQKERCHMTQVHCPHSQHVPKPPNYVPLSIGLLFVSPLCGVPCLVFALRAQRAHARGLEKLSRKNNDWAFILLIAGLMFLALLLLVYLVWQMTSALCLPPPSAPTPVTQPGGTPVYRQYTQQRSKNGIDHLNHSQVTIMPQFRSHDTMFQRPVKLKHSTSDRPPSVP